MNDSQITVRGNVATDVRHLVTDTGAHLTKFRLAATRRRFLRATNEWVDGETSFYSVTAWKFLAQNAAASLRKGDPVFVVGSLRVRDWSSDDGRAGTSVDIEADLLGHDLARGVATFQRVTRTREVGAGEDAPWRPVGAEGNGAAAIPPPGVDPLTGEVIDDEAAA